MKADATCRAAACYQSLFDGHFMAVAVGRAAITAFVAVVLLSSARID